MARNKRLDLNRMLKKYNFKGSKELQRVAYNAADKKAENLKKEALAALDSHEVTMEIEAGPSSSVSLVLGGSGSLFGFLGFEASAKPMGILRSAIEDYIRVDKNKGRLTKVNKTNFKIEFDINIPSMEEIYRVTPLTWTTQSWVKGIERGITNYTNTVFPETTDKTFPSSRSGVALQSRNKIRFMNLRAIPYITPILKQLKKKLK